MPQRSYPVPRDVVAVASRGLAMYRRQGSLVASATDEAISVTSAELLTEKSSIPQDAILRLNDHLERRYAVRPISVTETLMLGGAAGRSWVRRIAGQIIDQQSQRAAQTLTAAGIPQSDGCAYYGLLDPELPDQDSVVAAMKFDPATGTLSRWQGSAWESVAPAMEPAGFEYVLLDQDLLAEVLEAHSSGASLILNPNQPRAWTDKGVQIVASADVADQSQTESVYAIVDEMDTTAVLEVIRVLAGPVLFRRSGGEWVEDGALLAKLQSVDPPTVVKIEPDRAQSVFSQVDQYDQEHPPATTAAATYTPFDSSEHPRAEGGKFGTKSSSQKQDRGEQAADYISGKGPIPDGMDPKAGQKVKKKAAKKGRGRATGPKPLTPGQKRAIELKAKWKRADRTKQNRDQAEDIKDQQESLDEAKNRQATAKQIGDDFAKALASGEGLAKAEMRAAQLAGREAQRQKQWDQDAAVRRTQRKINRSKRDLKTRQHRQHIEHIEQVGNITAAGGTGVPTTAMDKDLVAYWTHGKGSAKIRWGTHGSFRRCQKNFMKYMSPAQVNGACANLYKLATGRWPGPGKSVRASAEPKITVAGLALVAKDTRRVLMLQRALSDDDPASGKWEFPGGHLEDGEDPQEGAIREWQEEVGVTFPDDVEPVGLWDAPNGIYRGHVFAIGNEGDLDLNPDHENRDEINPDDPHGKTPEVVAWFDPETLPSMPSLREECKSTDWDLIKQGSGIPSPV